jgi:AcrR family transcriptional regulator
VSTDRTTRTAGRRTRVDPDVRRTEILDAAREVMLERGLGATRVTDVADRAGVSHGLVHYYFPTKDDLVAATMHHVADTGVRRLTRSLAREETAVARLDVLLELALPSTTRTSDAWVLWVDAWSTGLRDETVRAVHRDLDRRWFDALRQVIADGTGGGEFTCADPDTTALTITSLIDGLSLRLVMRQQGVSRRRVVELLRSVAYQELGVS